MTRERASRMRAFWYVLVCLGLVAAILVAQRPDSPPLVAAKGGDPAFNPEVDVYFAATGQTSRGPFLSYWYSNRHIGMPVSPPVHYDGYWTQWFELARLQIPDMPLSDATAAEVQVLPIGVMFSQRVGYDSVLDAFVPKSDGAGRFFPDTGHAINHGFQVAYETWGIAEQLGPPISDEFSIGSTVYQYFQFGALSWSDVAGVQRVQLGSLDAGLHGQLAQYQPMPPEAVDLETAGMLEMSRLLAGERWIDVDLTNHLLTAYVGNYPVLESYVDTGHPNSPTVRGTFSIYLKNRVQSLQGVTWDGTAYYAPDVPYVMYFYQDYAIHPSSWRTTFGNSTSPGCVIPPLEVAELLWHWADIGTIVYVHD